MSLHEFRLKRPIGLLLLILALNITQPAAAQSDLAQMLAHNAAALVTVQFVLQVKMSGTLGGLMGEKQEFESEAVCVMIDPNGLVLCSNTQIGGSVGILQRVMGSVGANDSKISATPTQIRVLVASEAQALDASLLVQDSDLDLAWLQIKPRSTKRFAFLDFAKGVSIGVGTPVFALRRLDRFFDRAPSLLEGRIGGITSKPHPLYIPTGSIETNFGLPVVTGTGEAVGMLILQLPDDEPANRGGMSVESMTWAKRMENISRGVILPAAEVVKATQRATASIKNGPADSSYR